MAETPLRAGASRDPAAQLRRVLASGVARPGERRAIGVVAILAVFTSALMVLVWLLTGFGAFWPAWGWFGFACAFGLYWIRTEVRSIPDDQTAYRRYALHTAVSIYASAVVLTVWVLSGLGPFWPAWPLAGIAFAQLLHFLIGEHHLREPDSALTERVDELTRTRSGALDVQAAELRRIERDLHDGAQARLVALTMQLGRAEARLGDDVDPQTRALITGAQEEARLAIAELRDLARGIAPPVLSDRGLGAAVEALGKRSPLEVTVEAQIAARPAPVVESAAYFVIAESLTNAAKHSPGAAVHVTLETTGQRLRLVVADDGVGGADPHGSGLVGLAQRVGALDGTLTVVSPEGHGTTITAELPCGS